MNKFLNEILSLNTDFTLKVERIKFEETNEIFSVYSNYLVFNIIQKNFRLNYVLSKDNDFEKNENCLIYLREREDFINSKHYRDFYFFTRCRIRIVIKTCKKYFIFPIITEVIDDGKHFIFMLYIKDENKFYLFDSSGYTEQTEVYNELYYLFEDFTVVYETYKLQNLSDYKSTPSEVTGFCQSWGSFLIYCYIKFNREVSHLEIVNKILDHCGNSKVMMKKLVSNFTKFIINI